MPPCCLHSADNNRRVKYVLVTYNLLLVRVSLSTVGVHRKQCDAPALSRSSSVSFLIQATTEGTWVSVNCVHLTCGNQDQERVRKQRPTERRWKGTQVREWLGSGGGGQWHPFGWLSPHFMSTKLPVIKLPWIYFSKNSTSLHKIH